ncbi:cartilage acidic protein 1-like isoform X2 [Penaeus chinensis]|uniref:cartilage acidic protein 1-like isoform X2 n=1 Tax=Penaeus chinensis TaxID=139456 RepID=UPI001FB63FA1|nr:cartilage acidic protein 1-like isoform X2 [Penaeus chinensis]
MLLVGVLIYLAFLFTGHTSQAQGNYNYNVPGTNMFTDITQEVFRSNPDSNPVQLNYGVAVTDVDNDGQLEIVVAGYNGPNLVLKYNKEEGQLVNLAINDPESPYYSLRDVGGNAIGVCACDVDGDGREEIYFLNTNQAYSGMATYSDKLFKFRNGRYEDILNDDINKNIASYFAGRSVACIDRNGNGKYAVYLANYASGNVGPHSLIEMDENRSDVANGVIALRNVANEAGIAKLTGGRGVTVGPILSKDGRSDIFCDNEHGANFLFKNNGNGTFTDVAAESGVSDSYEHGRGVMLTDFDGDGKLDIVYGNWNGPHRLFLQTADDEGRPKFRNIATEEFARPSPIRTVIAADFNNDGNLEVLLNNIAYRGPAPNRLFQVLRGINGQDPSIKEINIGDALEPNGRGTGGAVTDLDGDGKLEVILSHGESAEQPISIYRVNSDEENRPKGWLRVRVNTQHGAPARGAQVTLHTNNGKYSRVIDAGSGYLCQMEPVAHFGFNTETPIRLEVMWPDTSFKAVDLNSTNMNSEMTVTHPGTSGQTVAPITSNSQCAPGWTLDITRGRCIDMNECDADNTCGRRYRCVNTLGSYKCVPNILCPEGYQASQQFTCEDVDECQGQVCAHFCTNTPGSYQCRCQNGYRLDHTNGACRDINECGEGTHSCQQYCHNHRGGYHCHCFRGYTLAHDRHSCRPNGIN